MIYFSLALNHWNEVANLKFCIFYKILHSSTAEFSILHFQYKNSIMGIMPSGDLNRNQMPLVAIVYKQTP